MTRVGFIGLGSQGGPMAQRIIEEGHPTTLWARRPATLEPFGGTGATFAASPAELAGNAELLCLCVMGDADVEEVFAAMEPGIQPGSVVAVHSTVHPETCTRLAARAGELGASLVDAPVSGGGGAASARQLLVMVGGDDASFERCRPVFQTYGDPIVHIGPLGTGQLAKLVNNLLFVANITLADGALALGASLGLDRGALAQVISRGSGNSFSMGVAGGNGIEALGQLAGGTLRKDVDIVTDVARTRGGDAGVLLEVANDTLARMGYPGDGRV
jgi:3-hydroxyisobutyrate dehydrogenase-like beta-hydroxyacid dehydrogenase